MTLPLLSGLAARRRVRRYRGLLRVEAKIGGELFGPILPGHRREFFCLDANTWMWHEEWIDKTGNRHAVTTRYDVGPAGTFKAQDGQPYQRLSAQEAKHFYQAVKMYKERVQAELYGAKA